MTIAPLRLIRLAAGLGSVALLVLAGWASVQAYRVESLLTTMRPDDMERAVRLAPSYSLAWARLGAVRERLGDSAGARAALERALTLNAYNADAWIELGLYWELQGEPARAERCLREAVRVDRTFPARWTLANFYLRQQDSARFWPAIREAVAVNRSDPSAAFELCWRASQDSRQILEQCVPDDPAVLRRYFSYLTRAGRTAALPPIWDRLEPVLTPAEVPATLTWADSLLADGRIDFALRVWNRLCDAGLIRHRRLDPSRGHLLTNGKFAERPVGQVFDWTLAPAEGVNAELERSGGGSILRLALSGTHREQTDLLWQRAPVGPQQNYRLTGRYSTSGLHDDTGLSWTAEDAASGASLAAGRPLAASETSRNWELRFRTGPKTRLVRLLFAYRRSPGTTRALGTVGLAELELENVGDRVR